MASKTIKTPDINRAILGQTEKSTKIKVGGLRGQHAVAVGMTQEVELNVIGEAGDFFASLNQGPVIEMEGDVGKYVADNMLDGGVIVHGSAGYGAGAYMKGGILLVTGSSGDGTGMANSGGTILVEGNSGNDIGLMQTAGSIIICGDVGGRVGHLMIGGSIFVGGEIVSLANNVEAVESSSKDRRKLQIYFEHYGIDADPGSFMKIIAKEDFTYPSIADMYAEQDYIDEDGNGLENILIPSPMLSSPVTMDYDYHIPREALGMVIGDEDIPDPLVSTLPVILNLPFDGLLYSEALLQISNVSDNEKIPYIKGLGKYVEGARIEGKKGSQPVVVWDPSRIDISTEKFTNCSGVVIDISSYWLTEQGILGYDTTLEKNIGGDGWMDVLRYPVPNRHLDMISMSDLRNHILLIREITQRRVPVMIRLAAGNVYGDLKLLLKTDVDSLIFKTGRNGYDRRLKGDRYPLIGVLSIIRSIREEFPEYQNISLGLETDLSSAKDILKCLSMGADYIVTWPKVGCGDCQSCEISAPCHELSPLLGEPEMDPRIAEELGARLSDWIDMYRSELVRALVGLSLSELGGLSSDLLLAKDYSTAAVTGLRLSGFDKQLPMWLH